MKVESSTISEIDYDGKNLYVTFVHGGRYAYIGVPASTFDELVAAESKGKFFHKNIRGAYEFVKMN